LPPPPLLHVMCRASGAAAIWAIWRWDIPVMAHTQYWPPSGYMRLRLALRQPSS
jgi:hypothetical protein